MNALFDFLAEYGLYLGIPLVFVLILAWIFRPSAKKRYEDEGNIPFDADK